MTSNASLLQRRLAAIPHGIGTAMPVFAERALNAELWDVEGRRYIDFAAGIAVLNVGHCHPRVVAAARAQLDMFTHTAFQVTAYESYIALAERLNALAPIDGPAKTILFSTGAEAVENAVKIARKATGRSSVIAFSGGFHGRSFMAMALTGKAAPYKRGFGPIPTEAGLTAIALVSMLAIPRSIAANNAPRITDALPASYRVLTVVLALLALFLFQAGNMSLAAFIIRLGEESALPRDFIGQALGWATWIGAAGAGLVIFMGTRLGRFRPMLAAILLTLAGTAGFFWAGSKPVFFIANVGTAITWSFVIPYLFGMISKLDPSGRLAALGGFVSKAGLATGPLAAGFILRNGHFDALIWLAIAALALSGVAALFAASQIDQLERSP